MTILQVTILQVKLLELRDRATFIPVMAANANSWDEAEAFLLRRAGYSNDGRPIILLVDLNGGRKAHYDPYAWGDRTFAIAHHYITLHWDMLKTGDVVDVEYILGETTTKKLSERVEDYAP